LFDRVALEIALGFTRTVPKKERKGPGSKAKQFSLVQFHM